MIGWWRKPNFFLIIQRCAMWLGRRSCADAVIGKLFGLVIYVAIARKPA